LTVAEIIGQVWLAAGELAGDGDGETATGKNRITNIVLMGMGEPLLNFDNVVAAIKLMVDDCAFGLSMRRVTLSTAGLVPAIDRLAESCPVSLAVSLHAPADALRDQLVPLNKKYPIAELLAACRRYVAGRPRARITFEYVLLAGVNDRPAHGARVGEVARRLAGQGEFDSVQPVAGHRLPPPVGGRGRAIPR